MQKKTTMIGVVAVVCGIALMMIPQDVSSQPTSSSIAYFAFDANGQELGSIAIKSPPATRAAAWSTRSPNDIIALWLTPAAFSSGPAPYGGIRFHEKGPPAVLSVVQAGGPLRFGGGLQTTQERHDLDPWFGCIRTCVGAFLAVITTHVIHTESTAQPSFPNAPTFTKDTRAQWRLVP